MPETLQIKRLTLDATLPTRASPGSVGYDLYSLNDLGMQPNSMDTVSYPHLQLQTNREV